MFEIDDKLSLLTENEKRELMLSFEELAQIEGLRDFAFSDSETGFYNELKALIDNKAEKNDVIKHDGSIALTNDWDVGDCNKIIADQIRARDSDGLLVTDDDNNGIFIKDGGNVVVGHTASSGNKLEVHSSSGIGSFRYNASNANGGFIILGRSRSSTIGTHEYCLANDEVGKFLAQASNGTAWTTCAGVYFYANQNHESGKLGSRVVIKIIADNSTTLDNALIIHNDKRLEIEGDLDHDGAKVGFFGVTPTTRQTSLTSQLTTLTSSSPVTPDYNISDPTNSNAYGFVSSDEFKTVMRIIANLQVRVAELESKLKNYGLLQ